MERGVHRAVLGFFAGWGAGGGSSGTIRFLPSEPLSIALGGKSLVFDWSLFAVMLCTALAYVLLGVCAALLYKALRWLASGRRPTAILHRGVLLRAVLLAGLYWAVCWVMHCFAAHAMGSDTPLRYALVATAGLGVAVVIALTVRAAGFLLSACRRKGIRDLI